MSNFIFSIFIAVFIVFLGIRIPVALEIEDAMELRTNEHAEWREQDGLK